MAARVAVAASLGGLVISAVPPAPAGAAPSALVFGHVLTLPNSSGGSEPRTTVTPDGRIWVITNSATAGTAVVYVSSNHGATWTKTAGNPAGQTMPTTDVDIVSTHTGRLIASELDTTGLNFPTSYSDDGGATWTRSVQISQNADQDRQWLAVGPDDASTHKPRVYLLFHDLLSGSASHNMYVETSTDGGATFGPQVPTTLPGSQAWLDLQCADSGGPSDIFVNQRTGQIYAVFGTRSSALGGCGASVFGPFEINVVAATRVWVVTSMDGSAGSWQQSLAVDDTAQGRIVGMQLAPGAGDSAGNIYVAYPESPNAYPDYNGAAIKVVHAPADLSHWSAPLTIAPAGGAGNVLPHIVAGDPGMYDVDWWQGVARPGKDPVWFQEAAQVLDGLAPSPTVSPAVRLSDVPDQAGTATILMGACGSGPLAGVENGFTCGRSTDVNGITLDRDCNLVLTWPAQDPEAGPPNTTFVATQTGGPTVCRHLVTQPTPTPSATVPPTAAATPTPAAVNPGLANTSGARAGAWAPAGALLLAGAAALAVRRRRRRRGQG